VEILDSKSSRFEVVAERPIVTEEQSSQSTSGHLLSALEREECLARPGPAADHCPPAHAYGSQQTSLLACKLDSPLLFKSKFSRDERKHTNRFAQERLKEREPGLSWRFVSRIVSTPIVKYRSDPLR
jgi:hypothetical protein